MVSSGRAEVGQNLLDRAVLQIGGQIRAEQDVDLIVIVVQGEPVQPADFFSLGPCVYNPTLIWKPLA